MKNSIPGTWPNPGAGPIGVSTGTFVYTTDNFFGADGIKVRIPFPVALITKWVETPSANKGFMIKNVDETMHPAGTLFEVSSVVEFASKSSVASKQPTLILHYKK